MSKQTIDGVPRDPCQWTDLQILDFLGVALRNVDLVGTVKLSEIRQGFEYMRAQSGAEQPAPVAVGMPERKKWDGLRATACNLKAEAWNACLDEVTRLTATVRIPERLVMTDGLHTYEYVTGHNAAIDKMMGKV